MKKIIFLVVLGVSLSSVAMPRPDNGNMYTLQDCSIYMQRTLKFDLCMLDNKPREIHNKRENNKAREAERIIREAREAQNK